MRVSINSSKKSLFTLCVIFFLLGGCTKSSPQFELDQCVMPVDSNQLYKVVEVQKEKIKVENLNKTSDQKWLEEDGSHWVLIQCPE